MKPTSRFFRVAVLYLFFALGAFSAVPRVPGATPGVKPTFAAQAGAAAATASVPDVGTVLNNVRKALGINALLKHDAGITFSGPTNNFGIETTFKLTFTPKGRYLFAIDGRLGNTAGFDGKTGWEIDWSGIPRRVQLEELETANTWTWVQTGLWAAPDGPFEVSVAKEQPAANHLLLNLKLKSGLLEAKLAVDRTSWLPQTMTRASASGEQKWEFSDYKPTLDFVAPRRVVLTDSHSAQSFTIDSAAPAKPEKTDPYAPPPFTARGTFKSDVAPQLEAKKAPTGHVLVHPRVNGRDVGWFIFDSGAGSMCIDRKTADKLNFPSFGKITATGVGGSVPAAFRSGETFELGPMTLSNVVFVELDLEFLNAFMGVPIAGICGYEVFARGVVEVDVEKATVALHDPSRYRLPAGQWSELIVNEKHPVIRGNFEGNRSGLFTLDLGAANTVTFMKPYVEREKLLEGRETTASKAGGVGGMSNIQVGHIEWFEIGGHRFEKPKVDFSLAQTGAFSTRYLAGNIGTQFIKPFVTIFNYGERKIAFVPKTEGTK